MLPFLALAGTWIVIRIEHREAGAPRALLRAFVLVGVWLVLTTELLSLGGWITPLGLVLAWGFPVVVVFVWIVLRRQDLSRVSVDFSQLAGTSGEWSLVVAILAVFGLTALVAFLAPPQTWDSLNYHMARVAHWAQMQAVRPFATGIEVQNSRTPLAEFGVLHTYVMASGDRWVNFVEWLAMVGSVIGVGDIARQLGLRRPAALLAMVFAATLPMGIVQASSTMTDYVVTLFLVATASEVLAWGEDRQIGSAILFAGTAAGLAILTKPTSAPYLVSLGLLGVWLLWRRKAGKEVVLACAAGLGVVLILNAGHWSRNVLLYGDPVSGGDQTSVHVNQAVNGRGLISNVLRNLGLHLGTPSAYVNKGLALTVLGVHQMIGIDPNDPRTTAHGRFKIDEPTTNENKSGNLVHLLVLIVSVIYLARRFRTFDHRVLPFVAAVLAGFLLFSVVFKWQIFGTRYHLQAFVLLAPAAGGAMALGFSSPGSLVAGWALAFSSLPWLFGIASRPLVPLPGEATVESILTESRAHLLLANGRYLEKPYSDMTQQILEASCSRVGIALSGNGAEYPLWVMLGKPISRVDIEWQVAGTPSEAFGAEGFMPCAVICEGCEGRDTFSGLPLARSAYGFRLYMGSEEGG